MTRAALLDDWPQIKQIWGRLQMGRHVTRIPGSLRALERYYATALTRSEVAFPVIEDNFRLYGFGVIHEAVSLELDELGAPKPNKVAFLRAVHIEGNRKEYSGQMSNWLNGWAKSRGARMIQGYCCLDFPLQAYERLHGIKPLFYVVGKDVV